MILRAMSALMVLTMSAASASATVTIYDDSGGQIGGYLAKYEAIRDSGEPVVIDGACASACTLLLGVVPRNQICVTSRAVLEFHSAWYPTPGGIKVSTAGNRYLWSRYPAAVRTWISRHGGLGPRLIYLRGPELAAMYPRCR
jgi:hypothetical protein